MSAEAARALITGLVASHGVKLRRFLLLRLRNAADVPDILQEVYLRMLRIPNVESIRSPEAYLFTVAQHVRSTAWAAPIGDAAFDRAERDAELRARGAGRGSRCSTWMPSSAWNNCRPSSIGCRRNCVPPSCCIVGTACRSRKSAQRLGTSLPMVKKNLMQALVQLRQRLERG